MKFYIPTSNLNLDNILQSECILPYSHYSHRCSGYKTFEQIDELRSFDAIVLFKYPVQFQINDTGRYNFPLLIELEDDTQTRDFADKEIQNCFFLCNHRLNLTPLNCRIYFFTENAYKLTLINTQSSKAIKYFKEYKIYPNASMLKLVNMPQLKEMSYEISKFEDNLIDKQKGLLYAFLLGKKMSVNRNLARQLRLTQELYNILTNLISSPTSVASFSAKLTNLLSDYKEVDSVETENLNKFHKNFNEVLGRRFLFLKESLIVFLRKIDCWDLVCDTLCKKWSCSLLPDTTGLKTERDFSILRDEIERRTSLAVSEYSKGIPSEDLKNVYVSGDYITFSEARLVNIVARYIMDNSITPEALSAKRMDFYMKVMTEIVSILKAEMGEQKWQESEEKTYVNSLYAFINDPTFSFNLNGIENVELKSIAAFILKGQSFKDCVAYLRINEIEDYRFVLSLWGCLCGYMEMNKDALSNVLTMSNYELIYKKIFGTGLAKITQHEVTSSLQVNVTNSIDLSLYKQILDVFKYKDSDKLINVLKGYNVTEDSVEICLNEVLNRSPFKKARKQCANACQALKIYLNRENKTVITGTIENSDLSKIGKKELLSLLGFDEPKKRKKQVNTSEQASLFPNLDTESDIVVNKNNYLDLAKKANNEEKPLFDFQQDIKKSSYRGQSISSLSSETFPDIPSVNQVNANVLKRLEQNWKFTGLSYKDDRREHIRYFIRLCKKEGRGESQKQTSLYKVFTIQLAEQIEKELFIYYGL